MAGSKPVKAEMEAKGALDRVSGPDWRHLQGSGQ
jgi:hypothetical protein